MFGTRFLTVTRALLVLVAVTCLAVVAQQWESVSFPLLVTVLVPTCLLGAMFVVYTERRKVAVRLAQVDVADERIAEYARANAELTRELLESRHIEATQQLQVRAFDAFLQGVVITDPHHPDQPIVFVNEGFTRLTGYTFDEAIGRNCRFLQGKDTSPDAILKLRKAIDAIEPVTVEMINYRKDGTPFWNALSVAPIIEDGHLTHFVGVQTDITPMKKLEQQLRQSSKMEAIGHLAGGIAHDFNNLLTIINGCCEVIRMGPPVDDGLRSLIAEIEKAGTRAATMTRQLLTFSRKAVLQPRVLSLNELVTDFQKLLVRLIGEDIQLTTTLNPQIGNIRVDQGQMEQVLMNLVVNARDAMPRGGKLTIETLEEVHDASTLDPTWELSTGKYVCLRVSDTGCGMDAETIARIFEPFFTTKPVGQGTGLGLAMVYGFVKSSRGAVLVRSQPHVGTTFTILLPIAGDGSKMLRVPPTNKHPGGRETILLVEDEEGVRRFVANILREQGYTVLPACDGHEALQICNEVRGEIQLLLTDVVMPGMSGRELAEHLRIIAPETRVIFTSGYTNDAVLQHGVSEAESDFLQKPFTLEALLNKIREVLDRVSRDAETMVSTAH